MQPTNSFKLAFLRHMLAGLRLGGVSWWTPGTSLPERKRAIKSVADMAMAFARGCRSRWSRALVVDLWVQEKNRVLARTILGQEQFERLIRRPGVHRATCSMPAGIRKALIGRSNFRMRGKIRKQVPARRRATSASLLARRIMTKRTQVLRRLVPGGKTLDDDASLLEETLDYVVFLQAQVDLMQRLTNALELSKCSVDSSLQESHLPEKVKR